MKHYRKICLTTTYLLLAAMLCSCDSGSQTIPDTPEVTASPVEIRQEGVSTSASVPGSDTGTRDNTPFCLVPAADGLLETRNDVAVIDYSHADQGYICADYSGSVSKIKLILSGPDGTDYTYDLHGNGYEVFPLSAGSGSYKATIYENISGTSYSTCLYAGFDAALANEFGPFLYPNQYVNFNADSKAVAKGAELAAGADTDLDVVISIYNYITASITYDYTKAADPPTGYVTDVDEILASGTGICLDYAALMSAMLRSQQIPTRLEVGYAKDAYHAWISVYTEETGWLNGLIEFTGSSWTLVDPTFGANSSEKSLKKFIGDGTNYTLKKVY